MSELLLRVSVKQLKMAHACPRQWAYHYLYNVPAVESPALYIGNCVHAQMKAYLQGTEPPHLPESQYAKMARELMRYASPRSPEAVSEIEKVIELPEFGIAVDLRCDFMDPDPGRDRPVFKDWKTTGAQRKTEKIKGKFWTLQSLEDDWQANVYAFLLMESLWSGSNMIDAEWCFVSKKFELGQTPRSWVVPHTFEYKKTREWFERMVPPVVELIRDMREARLDNARIVPHNPSSCEFSGLFCDASGHCRMVSSPVTTYEALHLPLLKGN